MKRQNVRVLVASEHPEARHFLRRLIEDEGKAVIVAEAENGTRALNLARTLRPDVALIDSYLPSVIGIDDIPLSRAGGLDVAQSVSEEIPNMRVVLLNRLNDTVLINGTRTESSALLCRETEGTCIPFTLSELSDQVVSPGSLIFANVESKEDEAGLVSKVSLSDKVLFAGILGGVVGWMMILTMFLATIGIYVFLAGVTTALLGLLGKVSKKIFK